MIKFHPLADRVVIRRLEDVSPGKLLATDADRSQKGVVLAVGPGKYDEDGYFNETTVKPGDVVLFNSKWNDLAHDEFKGSGCDGRDKLERPLSWRYDPTVHLVQEADIFCKVENG